VKKQILLSCTPAEVRVAVLEGSLLAELYIERTRGRGIVGNVYKARVQRVLPGMQAAFVDIGLDRSAFLHASDFRAPDDDRPPALEADDEALTEAADEGTVPVDVEDVSDVPVAESADGDGQSGEVTETGEAAPHRPRRVRPRRPIEEALKRGQEIVVQASKESMGTKGPRVTSYVSLAGRYLVYMPTTRHVGVSRRIEDDAERRRLRELVQSLRPEEGGFIVRTVCEGLSRRELQSDIQYLTRTWSRLVAAAESAHAPAILHSDLDLVERTVRDLFGADVGRVLVDGPEEYERLVGLVEAIAPRLKGRVSLHEGDEPLFDAYGVEAQIDKALDRRVGLRSGGYLVIDQTEALTAVDVNTGRFVGKRSQEETILRTNLEAAEEVVRQLRLRNLGGLIIIDFIDMENEDNRRQVYEALQEHVRKKDKAQTKILQISELGLVEMTRKRTRESLGQMLGAPCPSCDGLGHVKSPETVCYEILRRLPRAAARYADGTRLVVRTTPSVAAYLSESESAALDALERRLGRKIVVKAQDTLSPGAYEIVAP
jgi:ribonuclease G